MTWKNKGHKHCIFGVIVTLDKCFYKALYSINPLLHRYTFIARANNVQIQISQHDHAVWSDSTLFAFFYSLGYFWRKCDQCRSRSDGMAGTCVKTHIYHILWSKGLKTFDLSVCVMIRLLATRFVLRMESQALGFLMQHF
jgi:hypothetical protein